MNRRALLTAVLSSLLAAQALFAASNEVPHKPFPPAWQATLDLFPAPSRPTGEGLVAGAVVIVRAPAFRGRVRAPREGLVPGAAVIVRSPAFGVRVGVTGYPVLPAKKMSPDFHFRVGSVTKSFT